MAFHVAWPAYGCIHSSLEARKFLKSILVFSQQRGFSTKPGPAACLNCMAVMAMCSGKQAGTSTLLEIKEAGPLTQAVLPVVLRKCCCSQQKRVFLWLHPNRQSVWHRPDFSLEQPHHDNMSDGHVCPLTVVSVLWYFRPEFRNTVSFKGALSRSVMNYKFHEMFDMTELFGRTFKPFPKLSSVICFIKHASNFALEHVSSWHAGSSV